MWNVGIAGKKDTLKNSVLKSKKTLVVLLVVRRVVRRVSHPSITIVTKKGNDCTTPRAALTVNQNLIRSVVQKTDLGALVYADAATLVTTG